LLPGEQPAEDGAAVPVEGAVHALLREQDDAGHDRAALEDALLEIAEVGRPRDHQEPQQGVAARNRADAAGLVAGAVDQDRSSQRPALAHRAPEMIIDLPLSAVVGGTLGIEVRGHGPSTFVEGLHAPAQLGCNHAAQVGEPTATGEQ
jgi:hypothetical protein